MSKLDDAMLEHIAYIVRSENRPFSYVDFLSFDVHDERYEMAYGTIRNKLSRLKKQGQIELSYYSVCAFYTLKGRKFGKPMTPNHTVVHTDPVYKMLLHLPFGKRSIHDIRLKFKLPNIWNIFSIDPSLHRNERSQDIAIPTWSKNNTLIRIIIHKTDSVSVTIGCSLMPIPLDFNGIIWLFTLLARVEEKLQTKLEASVPNNGIRVPDYASWIVTMWHFGRDGLTEYGGEKFSITIEKLENIFRFYIKDFKSKYRPRIEKQEYPKKQLGELIDQILSE